MRKQKVVTCAECGQVLAPWDETCPECGELTRLGLRKERDTRREAGLAGFQRGMPRVVAMVLLLILAAAAVYAYLYHDEVLALWAAIVKYFQPEGGALFVFVHALP